MNTEEWFVNEWETFSEISKQRGGKISIQINWSLGYHFLEDIANVI